MTIRGILLILSSPLLLTGCFERKDHIGPEGSKTSRSAHQDSKAPDFQPSDSKSPQAPEAEAVSLDRSQDSSSRPESQGRSKEEAMDGGAVAPSTGPSRGSLPAQSSRLLQRVKLPPKSHSKSLDEGFLHLSEDREARRQLVLSGSDEVARPAKGPLEFVKAWLKEEWPAGPQGLEFELLQQRESRKASRYHFYFRQRLAGLPVEDSQLRVNLFVSEDSYRVISITQQIAPAPVLAGSPKAEASEAIHELLRQRIFSEYSLEALSVQGLIFYPFHYEDLPSVSRAVWKVFAVDQSTGSIEAWSFYFDQFSLELIHKKRENLHFDSEGFVEAWASPDDLPIRPETDLVLRPLRRAFVETPSFFTHTDLEGFYQLLDPDPLPHSVTSSLFSTQIGRGLQVFDAITSMIPELSTVISSNQNPLNFLFNHAPTDTLTATINSFIGVEKSYRYFVDRGAFGVLDTQVLQVQANHDFLHCNAAYIPDLDDDEPALLLFFQEGGGCRNSAYSTIVAHEYGHHVVNRLILDQGAFGEGYADTLAMLLYDVPGIGFDLFQDDQYLRHPTSENVRYPCSGGIYTCGSVLSALFWDLRMSIGLEATRQLHVDWSLETAGGLGSNAVLPQTIVELLLADSDTGDLSEGTPHWKQICGAAKKRGLSCPKQLNGVFGSSIPQVIFPGQSLSLTLDVFSGIGNPQAGTGAFHYRINAGSWQQIAMTVLGPNQYEIDLPILQEGDVLEFYFSADSSLGLTQNFPSAGSQAPFSITAQSPFLPTTQYSVPKNPVRVLSADLQERLGGLSSVFVLTDRSNRGLLEFSGPSLGLRRAAIARLPESFTPGAGSVFYRRTDRSQDFFMTNHSRTEIYWGQSDDQDPVFHPTKCKGFSRIKEILFVEGQGGARQLVVLDEGRQKISSFQLDSDEAEFCVNRQDFFLEGVEWIKPLELDNGNPGVFVGSRSKDGLWVRILDVLVLGSATPSIRISESAQAEFRDRFVEPISHRLIVGITKAAGMDQGEDQIIQVFEGETPSAQAARTCRAPDQILMDFDGANRQHFVLCKVARTVQILDENLQLVGTLPAGSSPRKMLVGSDGTSKWIAVLQNQARLVLHRFPGGSTQIASDVTTTTINLPGPMTDMGLFASLDGALLSSYEANLVAYLDFDSASIVENFYFPNELDGVALQSANLGAFASSKSNSVYEIVLPNFLNSGSLSFYPLSGRPIQVASRPNRIYALTRNENRLAVINTATAQIQEFPVQNRPNHFDFDLTRNELWVANRDSQSVSRIDINPAGESVVAHYPLNFFVSKVQYDPIGERLYAAGGTQLRAYHPDTFNLEASYDLGSRITELQAFSFNDGTPRSGVLAASADNWTLSFADLNSANIIQLEGSPQSLSVHQGQAVVSQPNQQQFQWVDFSQSVSSVKPLPQLQSMFPLQSSFATFSSGLRSLRFFLFDGIDGLSFPSIEIFQNSAVDFAATDGGQNIWLMNRSEQSISQLLSGFQPEVLGNLTLNRPVDLLTHAWAADDRLYVLLRNLAAVAVIDLPGGEIVQVQKVCRAPKKMALDSDAGNRRLFVLCPRDHALSVLNLNAEGLATASSLWVTRRSPSDLHLIGNNLYVSSREENRVQRFNGTTGALLSEFEVGPNPVSLVEDEANELLFVISSGSTDVAVINTDTQALLPNPLNTSRFGLSGASINPNTGSLFAFSITPASVFAGGINDWQLQGPSLVSHYPSGLFFAEGDDDKIFVTYPESSAIRIYNEDDQVIQDLEIGLGASWVRQVASAGVPKAFVSLRQENEIAVVNVDTASVIRRRSLSEACRPKKMAELLGRVFVLCEGRDLIEVFEPDNQDAYLGSISLRLR